MDEILLEVKNLKKYFPIEKGFFKTVVGHVKSVDNISFKIKKGITFGLVGESGCGKSTTARTMFRAYQPTEGKVYFNKKDGEKIDIFSLSNKKLRSLRKEMQMVFQDPYSSLNPRMTVKDIIGDPLKVNNIAKGKELEDRVGNLLEKVGLKASYMSRYPHAFSGGQRQRVAIARALSVNPQFIACDESVSALDVSVQAQIINLLKELQNDMNLTYLFIAHDLSVIKHICDQVAVMYVGKIVEIADTEDLFTNPLHPYTEALLSSVPKTDPDIKSDRIMLDGEIADPSNPPKGCYFHPRCNYSTSECKNISPEFREYGDGHMVACHRVEELALNGIKEMEVS